MRIDIISIKYDNSDTNVCGGEGDRNHPPLPASVFLGATYAVVSLFVYSMPKCKANEASGDLALMSLHEDRFLLKQALTNE